MTPFGHKEYYNACRHGKRSVSILLRSNAAYATLGTGMLRCRLFERHLDKQPQPTAACNILVQ
jgi:hypothetical protein